ncbi:porphobilinogen deaminase [Tulasnella sp. 330]|nr:porphobilinogen deaminase [Tulasnella sp. 330]KAG8882053.1 porphobilinogen deaminase [Tulasnella sp. 332]
MESDPAHDHERPPRRFVIGSRASKLAVIQAEIVHEALMKAHPQAAFALSFMTTEGDKNQAQALYLMGGAEKALWTKELEVSLLDGDIDLIVHCLKDVPTTLPDRCELGAIMEREDPRDCLVVKAGLPYKRLEDLPEGSVIGTSSIRRVAQLRRAFPNLKFADVRGNLNTRLGKLDKADGEYTALILASAGLVRLGFMSRVTCQLGAPTLYYAVGQAALAIEVRSDDSETKELVAGITHHDTNLVCRAERSCLKVLEGGCSVPVGMNSEFTADPSSAQGVGKLRMTGTVTSLDGSTHVECTEEATISSVVEAETVGQHLAQQLMASGAKQILEDIVKAKQARIAFDQSAAAITSQTEV